jgi:AraC-like DNA-binding protein
VAALEKLHAGPTGEASSSSRLASVVRLVRAERPRVERSSLDVPWMLVVLAGDAVLSSCGTTVRASPGDLLVLPARVELEVALGPDRERGFAGLEVEILAEALVRWLPADLDVVAALDAWALRPRRPGSSTTASLAGLCEGVTDPGTHPWSLEHQLAGVLLGLALDACDDPAERELARARLDLALTVRQLVRARPDHGWSTERIAVRLGLSPATLRRRLAQHGTGLRQLVNQERMSVARTLLGDGRLNVTEVALRCGYGSPAKFARQFKHAYGVVPSHFRLDHTH